MTYENNRFVPMAPKTYEVRYVENQEQQKPKLSLAARQKVIQKYGSDYQSERLNEINPGYGPMPQSSEETEKFHFSYSYHTGSQVHDYMFEENKDGGRSYYRGLARKGVDNGRSLLQKLESGSIRVVDKRKDVDEINFDSERTESVKKSLREVIKEYEEKGECGRAFIIQYNA